MPFSKYLNNNNVEQAPANAAGASSAYNPFAKYAEDRDKLDSRVKSDVVDFLTSNTGVSNKPIILDFDEYKDYGVYLTDNVSKEQLDKERAKNQSAWEQAGRAVVNTVTDVGLGIGMGFADIVDIILNIGNEQNDYQNAVSTTLNEWKEAVNERMKIYRENPDTAFDVSDFGWWMENAPSIFSSLSLMVPGMAAGKAISAVGKLTRLNKVANKIANAWKLSERTRDTIGAMGQAAIRGATMRFGENYLEARQTFNDVQASSERELNKMSASQKETFFTEHPEYKGMSDADIATDIASKSADITFATDWANIGFDIMQIYTLRKLWGNKITGNASARNKRINETVAASLNEDKNAVLNAVKGETFWRKTVNKAKDISRDTLTLARTEWTEGVEEGINYIAQQEGLYAGKKYFDKEADETTLNEYLKDPHLWESAFWGVLGGVVFGGAYPAAVKAISKRMNNEWISAEKQQEAEILGRLATTQKFTDAINKVNSGINPYTNAPIETSEQQAIKELVEKDFMDALVINAANAGNLDLLNAFVHDDNFKQGLGTKLGLQGNEVEEMIKRFDDSYQSTVKTYNDTVLRANKLGASFEVAKIIASNAVEAEHTLNVKKNIADAAESKFNNLTSPEHVSRQVNSYIEDAKDGIILQEYDRIAKQIEATEKRTDIKSSVRNKSIAEAQNRMRVLNAIRPVADLSEEAKRTKLDAYRRLRNEHKDVLDSYINYAQNRADYENARLNTITNDQSIKRDIERYNNIFDKARAKIVQGAMEDMSAMYKKYGRAVVDTYRSNKPVDEIEDNDKKTIDDALAALNLDSEANEDLNLRLKTIAAHAENERLRAASAPNVEEVKAQQEAAAQVMEAAGAQQAQGTSPTGGQTQTSPVTPPPVANPAENPPSSPPVEEGTGIPQTNIVEPKLQIAATEGEQYLQAEEIAWQFSADERFEEGYLELATNNDEAISVFVEHLKGLGFSEQIATNAAANVVSTINGQMLSSGDITDNLNVSLNIIKFGMYNDVNNLKEAIKEFVNAEFTDKNNQTRRYGRELDGKTYINLGELFKYLQDKIQLTSIVNDTFERVKEYLFSDKNTEYIVIDEVSIRNIDRFTLQDYLNAIRRAQGQLVRELSNEVNLEEFFDGTDEDIARNVELISTITDNSTFKVEKDNRTGRIYILRNGRRVGYMGMAYEFDGTHARVNKGWNYDTRVDMNKIIHSDLMDFMMTFVDDVNKARMILKAVDEINKLEIDTNNLGIYDETSNTPQTAAYKIYIDLFEQLKAIAPQFISDKITSDTDKAMAAKHFADVVIRAIENNDKTLIYDWFEHLEASYNMTDILSKHPDKRVHISVMDNGYINTEETKEYEGNVIEDTIVGYDENVNEIAVAIKNKAGEGMLFTAKNEAPISVPHGIRTGVPLIKITKPGGYTNWAHCVQVPINKITNSEVKSLLNGVLDEIEMFAQVHLAKNSANTLAAISDRLKMIFGADGLINGLKIGQIVGSNTITINIENPSGKDIPIVYFNLSGTDRNGRPVDANVFIDGTSYRDGIGAKNAIRNKLAQAIMNNCTFSVPAGLINDGAYSDRKINQYVYRENGKTVVNIGKYKGEYKSYQDFLVSNGLLKTKLRNDKTPRVVRPGVIAYGNFIYSKDTTGIKVKLPVRIEKATAKQPTLVGARDLFTSRIFNTPGNKDIESIVNNINSPENFITYMTNVAASRNLLAKAEIEYYKHLYGLGMFSFDVVITNEGLNRGESAYYDSATETIYVTRPNVAKAAADGKIAFGRLINILLHENIHGAIDIRNKRTANRRGFSEQVTTAMKPVYEEYLRWFNEQDEAYRKDKNNRLLARIHDDGSALTDEDYEEFMVECMTNVSFMNTLNGIESYNVDDNKKTSLFAKIMDIIAKLFGININHNSLLAKARAAVANIETEVETEESTVTEDNNIKEENSIEQNSNNEEKITSETKPKRKRGRFSIPHDVMTTEQAISQIPMDLIPQFNALIATGDIGTRCI